MDWMSARSGRWLRSIPMRLYAPRVSRAAREGGPHLNLGEARPPLTDLRQQLSVGAVWTGIGLAAAAAASFCVTVVLARVMRPTEYGLLSTAIAGAGLASVVAGAGLNQAVAHVGAAQQQLRGRVGVVETTRAALSVAWWVAVAVCAAAVIGVVIQRALFPGQSPLLTVLATLTPVVAVFPIAAVLNGTLLASYRPRAFALGSTISAVATLLIVTPLLLLHQRSPVDVAAAKSVAAIAGLAFLAIYYVKGVAGPHRPDEPVSGQDVRTMRRALRRQLLAAAPAMVLMGFFAAAISQLDVLLVGIIRGSQAAAIYQPTSRILDLIGLLLACFAPFFLALASRAAARGDRDEVGALQHWTSRWALALAAPVLALLLVTPDSALHVLFGSGYVPPSGAARLLGLAGAAACTLGFAGYSLAALGHARVVGRVLAGFLALDLLACAGLIPPFGVLGAATATAACLVFSTGLCSLQLWRRSRIAPWNRQLLATIAAFVGSLFMAALVAASLGGELARSLSVMGIASVFTIGASYASGSEAERRAFLTLITEPVKSLRRPSSS